MKNPFFAIVIVFFLFAGLGYDPRSRILANDQESKQNGETDRWRLPDSMPPFVESLELELDLTPLQKIQWDNLANEFNRKMVNELGLIPEDQFVEYCANVTDRLLALLTPQQQQLAKQFRHVRNWYVRNNNQMDSGLFGNVEIQQLLKLDDAQIDLLKENVETLHVDLEGLELIAVHDKESLAEEFQQRLYKALSPDQQKRYNKLMGENFSISGDAFRQAKSRLESLPVPGPGEDITRALEEPLPLVSIYPALNLNLPPAIPALLKLATAASVADELSLSNTQRQRIDELAENVFEEFSRADRLEASGTDLNQPKWIIKKTGEPELVKNYFVDDRDIEKQLKKILKLEQQRRLSEIYLQWLVFVKTEAEIPLMHPHWPDVLELSPESRIEFRQIGAEYKQALIRANTKLRVEVHNTRIQSLKDALKTLKEEQLAQWTSLTGNFGTSPKKLELEVELEKEKNRN